MARMNGVDITGAARFLSNSSYRVKRDLPQWKLSWGICSWRDILRRQTILKLLCLLVRSSQSVRAVVVVAYKLGTAVGFKRLEQVLTCFTTTLKMIIYCDKTHWIQGPLDRFVAAKLSRIIRRVSFPKPNIYSSFKVRVSYQSLGRRSLCKRSLIKTIKLQWMTKRAISKQNRISCRMGPHEISDKLLKKIQCNRKLKSKTIWQQRSLGRKISFK